MVSNSAPPPSWEMVRFRAIVETQTAFICCYLADGTLTYVNDAYCTYFQRPREALIGTTFIDFIEETRRPGILDHIQWQVQHKTPRREVVINRLPEGRTTVVEWVDQALCDADGSVIEILAVGHDATALLAAEEEHRQLEAAERELMHARAELSAERELNAFRANLLRLMTHELRTPLSIIQTSTDILERYRERLNSAERESRIGVVQQQIRLMVQMMDDIAFSLRAKVTPAPVEIALVDVNAMITRMIQELELTIGRFHRFQIEIAPTARTARFDKALIHRALMNLLTNAIKYSPPHTRIDVGADAHDAVLQIRVIDHGIGIPKTDLPHLFEPFFRGTNVGSIDGTGIGLSLVRDCVAAHGGAVSVESEIGQGTRFTLIIPQPHPEVNGY
ncbi:MAG: ATP-binding protein [bacterium]|nr:ATP-binding protein [bacterium]